MTVRALTLAEETWPIAGRFTISRGAATEIKVVVAAISQGGVTGRGECRPYARYDETTESVIARIETVREPIESGCSREALQNLMPAGAARNALDCALWDLEAKLSGKPVWQLADLPRPEPVTTAFTISLGTPEEMAAGAAKAAGRPLLKLKLGGAGDDERVKAVRAARPDARLIVDANEAWTPDLLTPLSAAMAVAGVELIEQPLPAGQDETLEAFNSPVPLCADESAHDSSGLSALAGRYAIANLKLDKTGGLTEAIKFARTAQEIGLELFVGCMVGTSLAMAPALLLASRARYVDLDGPLLLARDRNPKLRFDGACIDPAPAELWG